MAQAQRVLGLLDSLDYIHNPNRVSSQLDIRSNHRSTPGKEFEKKDECPNTQASTPPNLRPKNSKALFGRRGGKGMEWNKRNIFRIFFPPLVWEF